MFKQLRSTMRGRIHLATERPETLEVGSNVLAGTDPEKIEPGSLYSPEGKNLYFRVQLTFKEEESMTGTRLEDIERMHKLVGIFSGAATKKLKVWDDVGIFENLFPKDQSSVELSQELRKKDSL